VWTGEVASLTRSGDPEGAVVRLRAATELESGDAEAVVSHVTLEKGKCRVCGQSQLLLGFVPCNRCGAKNYDW
jgi:hypothetical protein